MLKQHNIGSWYGKIMQSIAQISLATGLLSLFLLLVTMTTSEGFRYLMVSHGWDISMYWVFVAVGAIIAVLLVVSYLFAMPSSFAEWNVQFWNHGSLLRKHLEKRDAEVDLKFKAIMEELKSLRQERGKVE